LISPLKLSSKKNFPEMDKAKQIELLEKRIKIIREMLDFFVKNKIESELEINDLLDMLNQAQKELLEVKESQNDTNN
jgi:hypothetical protein